MHFRHFAPLLLVTLAAVAAPAPLREYLDYPSRVDPQLRLFARFECTAPSGILLVNMHGWHGAVKKPHTDDVPDPLAKNYFVISPEMRGRGDATGQPDCNGWELQDVIDAVEFARRHYRDRIASPELVFLSGGSGGGGNVFALIGKFPDTFAAARAYYGISDYALWHTFDRKGEFRDELEGINGKDPKGRPPWIGGSPETNPEAYRSRGGLTTVANLLTPTLVFHGADDARVPVLHAVLVNPRAPCPRAPSTAPMTPAPGPTPTGRPCPRPAKDLRQAGQRWFRARGAANVPDALGADCRICAA